jgi:hypothetical protein
MSADSLKLARRNPVHDHLFPTSLRLSIHSGEGLEQRHWLDLRWLSLTETLTAPPSIDAIRISPLYLILVHAELLES